MQLYRITFEVAVEDEALLRAYAQEQREVAWRDGQEWMADKPSLPEVLMEALLFSNENPSPDEYGIGFTGVWTSQRQAESGWVDDAQTAHIRNI